jgi:hypothetical protein
MNYWPDLTNFVNIHVNFNTMCTDRPSQDSATTSAPLDHMKSLESINWIGTCEEYIRRTVYIPTAEVANGKLRPIYFGIEFTQVRWWRKKRFQTHVRSDSRHRKGRITFWKSRPWPCLDWAKKLKFFHSLHHINLCTHAWNIKYR